jgi:hypothetical protein
VPHVDFTVRSAAVHASSPTATTCLPTSASSWQTRSPCTTPPGVGLESGAEAYLLSAGASVDVFGLRSNEIPDAVRRSVVQEYPRLGFKREFAGLLRAEAKQVPRGRAWYMHRFAMSDLSVRLAPFRD